MIRPRVFLNNRTQVVRLPKAVALHGDVRQVTVIAPAGESWDSWFDAAGVTPDFLTEREQPLMQKREAL